MLLKQKSSWLPRNVALRTWQIAKSAISPLFNGVELLSSASDKAKLFAQNFSNNSNFDDSGILKLGS